MDIVEPFLKDFYVPCGLDWTASVHRFNNPGSTSWCMGNFPCDSDFCDRCICCRDVGDDTEGRMNAFADLSNAKGYHITRPGFVRVLKNAVSRETLYMES